MKYIKPNFDEEWNEASRYPEFEEMGYEGWLDKSQNDFQITNYEEIKDVLFNVNLDYDSLEDDKKERFERAFESGEVEIPIVIKFSDDEYDLLGGNTRLAGLIKNNINPKLWVIDLSNDYEMNESEELKGGNADNKSLVQIAKKHDAKNYYHIDNMVKSLKKELEMGIKIEMEHTDDEDKAKEIAMDHLWENPSYYTKLKKSEIEEAKKEINEKCWKGYTQKGMKTMFGKRYPNCVKKETNEASSPAQQAAIAINMKKKGIEPKEEVTGNKEIDKKLDNNQQDMVYGIVDIIKKIKDKDNRLSVANDMIKKFKEENIQFDYDEFLNMCGCTKKTETKEQTDASSSGSYEGNAFGPMIKREIHKIHNSKLTEQEVEFKEATDASSSGSYDVPAFGKTTKGGRKNPLKIDGPDSIYKGRAVKDKNFPKWGGPDSVFVKVKDKCKKFPYCNQGNTGALEFIKEDQEIKSAITETSKKFGIPYKEMEKIVLNEISKIFI